MYSSKFNGTNSIVTEEKGFKTNPLLKTDIKSSLRFGF